MCVVLIFVGDVTVDSKFLSSSLLSFMLLLLSLSLSMSLLLLLMLMVVLRIVVIVVCTAAVESKC